MMHIVVSKFLRSGFYNSQIEITGMTNAYAYKSVYIDALSKRRVSL